MCCLFGLIDHNGTVSSKRKERILKILSAECEARGTDATGIAYISNGRMLIHKAPLPAHKMKFKLNDNPKVIMGHTRMTTQGSEKNNFNNHPFYSTKLKFALAHNGILCNDAELRKSEKLPKTYIKTDSYIAVQLIDKKEALTLDSLKYMAEKVEGSFCFTVLDKYENLYIVKGDNPIVFAKTKDCWIYASTDAILEKALNKLGISKYSKFEIDDGKIVKIAANGEISEIEFEIQTNFYGYLGYSGYYGNYDRYTFNSAFSNKYKTQYPKAAKYIGSLAEYDREYLDTLLYYGCNYGIDENVIMSLLENGCTLYDIEDIIVDCEYM